MSLRPGPGRPENGNCCGATMTKIDPNILRSLLRYEPETGKLFWLERDPSQFVCGKRSADWACKAWNSKNAGNEAFTANSAGYRSGAVLQRLHLAHRIIWAMVFDEWPDCIDHINGNRADNRIQNLRSVSKSQNSKNMKKPSNNSSGFQGVHWCSERRKWVASVGRKSLGRFRLFEDAISARKSALKDLGYHENHGRSA